MIEVEVEDKTWREVADVEALVTAAAGATLAGRIAPSPLRGGSGWGAVSAAAPGPGVTILLTDDATIQDLNARFRSKDAPTNVLSFPAAASAHPHLGDLALAHGVCAREAAAQGKSLADHLSHLVVHGLLHLLGHDHEDDAPAEAMEALERVILSELGVADPYREDLAHV